MHNFDITREQFEFICSVLESAKRKYDLYDKFIIVSSQSLMNSEKSVLVKKFKLHLAVDRFTSSNLHDKSRCNR